MSILNADGTPYEGNDSLDAQTIVRLATPRGKQVFPPTEEQAAVIEAAPEPLLVVAGAGAGKTTTMSLRVLHMVAARGIDPETILGLTFTRKAAGELGLKMRRDLETLADNLQLEIDGAPTASTYNAFAGRIVSEYGLRIGVDPDARLLGQAAAVQLMTDIVESWTGDLPSGMSPQSAVSSALHLAGHLAEHNLTVAQGRMELEELHEELTEIGRAPSGEFAYTGVLKDVVAANDKRLALMSLVEAFERAKRDQGLIDFSDQLALATRIVTTCPDVVESIRKDYRVVLLDEFQDTSVIQMDLLSALFANHATTAVGDPNQSIYGWRGASASSLETFLTRFARDGYPGQQLTLSTAWRNDQAILDAANALALPLREHSSRAKSPILQARPHVGPGRVECIYTPDVETEITHVVDFVREHRVCTEDAAGRPTWKTVAILCRRRRDFPALERALKDADIPVQVVGLGGLLDQPAVSDIRAALELSADVTQSPWLMRLLASADIGAADLSLLAQRARFLARKNAPGEEHPEALLMDAVENPPEVGWSARETGPTWSEAAHQRVAVLAQRLKAVRAGMGRSLVDQVERAIAIMGTRDDILADPLGNSGLEALDAFVDVAVAYEQEVPGADLRGFLSWLAIAEEEENGLSVPQGATRADAVQLVTVHSAKGLEWDSVVVFALEDSVFPSHDSSRKTVTWREDPPGAGLWLTQPSELPYPIRRDSDDLPAFVPEAGGGQFASYFANRAAEKGTKRSTPASAFNSYVKDELRPQHGAHREREERRLAYVAVTRARANLLLIGSWIDGGVSLKQPSRYLMETREALLRRGYDPRIEICEPPQTDVQDEELPEGEELPTYPITPGRSRALVGEAAQRVRERSLELQDDRDIFDVLAELEPHPLVRDTLLLIEERRASREATRVEIRADRLPATAVSSFIADHEEWATQMRRPIPSPPSHASALGTLFHAWIERQLHQVSGELWDEPVVGMELLTDEERHVLTRMQENFRSLDMRGARPIAIEEPFSVEVAGISIQGRIDAVFEEQDGSFTVVDWKSGHVPGKKTPLSTYAYYARQLELYRLAWSQRQGCPVESVGARVIFLAGPRTFTLEELMEHLADSYRPLGEALAQTVEELSQTR